MSPLFGRKPKMHRCRLCSEHVEEEARYPHYETHLIEVTDNNGFTAYTFKCPQHGLMDQAWGGGRNNPKGAAVSAITAHFLQVHRDTGVM